MSFRAKIEQVQKVIKNLRNSLKTNDSDHTRKMIDEKECELAELNKNRQIWLRRKQIKELPKSIEVARIHRPHEVASLQERFEKLFIRPN